MTRGHISTGGQTEGSWFFSSQLGDAPQYIKMNSHVFQDNQLSHHGYVSFEDSRTRPREGTARTVLTDSVSDEFLKARLNNFTSDILGDLADRWIGLFEPQLDYFGSNPVWWPDNITLMSPRRMVKRGKTPVTLPLSKLTRRR
jgi:hypothetical protein